MEAPFPVGNPAHDPWNPLNFSSPAQWRDAIAEDMWRQFQELGLDGDYMTSFQRAQFRAYEEDMAYASYAVPEDPRSPRTPPRAASLAAGRMERANGGVNTPGSGDGSPQNPFVLQTHVASGDNLY